MVLGATTFAALRVVARSCGNSTAAFTRFGAAPLGGKFRAFSDLRFTKTHEWLKVDNGTATMGISDFAQSQLGEVVYVDLPSEGASFGAQETICTLESVKAVGEVYAPMACEVVASNDTLSDEPGLVNSSPLADGWLVKIKFSTEAKDLMDVAAYEEHVKEVSEE